MVWRRMRSAGNPAECLGMLLNAEWRTSAGRTRLAPEVPDALVSALVHALGEKKAARWAGEYLAAVAAKNALSCRPAYLDALKRFVVK